MSSDSDDAPLSSLKGSPRKRKPVSYAEESGGEEEEAEFEEEEEEEEDEESSEDDDVPLASLKKSPAAKAKPKPKTPSSVTKKKAKTSSASKDKSSSVKMSDNYQSASAALYESGCKKGQLIQKLLCRWWYATVWPDPDDLPDRRPKHYDSLDGFPGVYVCSSGDDVGRIKDYRKAEHRPSFANYAMKSSKELQEMLLKAMEEQKRQLIDAEGSGTITEKELDREIKTVQRMSPDAADKEAVKVLKAAKMKIG